MNNLLGVILTFSFLFLSVNLKAEEIVECQSEYCVDYFKKFKMAQNEVMFKLMQP